MAVFAADAGERMKRGCFTVVDATNIRGRDMTAYKKLANEYKYRIYVVDFTDITLEEAKKRNMLREEYNRFRKMLLRECMLSWRIIRFRPVLL